jgi:peroxiredoxin Q/BCP
MISQDAPVRTARLAVIVLAEPPAREPQRGGPQMAKTPELGSAAPDFTPPGVHLTAGEATRAEYTLSAQRGRPLVLAFYPGDETAACTRQLCSCISGFESFDNLGAVVWGLNPQDVDSHERFARKRDLKMPLLADTGLAVSRQYGITLGSAACADRCSCSTGKASCAGST